MISKILWAIRGLFYKPFFGSYNLPSYIGKPLYIKNFKHIYIGKKVRIFPNARIEVHDNLSKIVIKDNVSIGQNLHIISGCKQELIIGKNTTFSANVFVTNVDHKYDEIDKHILEQPLVNANTKIGDNCFVGYGAVIQAGTVLGKQCIVGSNAVVRGIFPDYSVIVGIPAKIVKRYDVESRVWRKTDSKGNFIDDSTK